MVDDLRDIQKSQESLPSEHTHALVKEFAESQGPVLKKDGQEQLAAGKKSDDLPSLPSAESLMEQLRYDARKLEDAGPFGKGKDSSIPQDYFERQAQVNEFHKNEQGILDAQRTVFEYKADDLKNIGDLVSAAAQDPEKINEIMQRMDDPIKFINLWTGISLQQDKLSREQGGNATQIELIPAFHTEDNGAIVVNEMEVMNRETQEDKIFLGPKVPFKPVE